MKEFIEEKLKSANVGGMDIDNIMGMLNFNDVEILEFNGITADQVTKLHVSGEAFVLYEAEISQKVDIRELARPMIIKTQDFVIVINPTTNYILAINEERVWAGTMKAVSEKNLAVVGKVKMKDFVGFDNTQKDNPLIGLLGMFGGNPGMETMPSKDLTRKRMICSFMHTVIMDRSNPIEFLQRGVIDIMMKLRIAQSAPRSNVFIELSKEAKDVVVSDKDDHMIERMLQEKFDDVIGFVKDKSVPKEVVKYMQLKLDKLKREKCKTCPAFLMNEEVKKIDPSRMSECIAISVKNKLDSNNLAHE